MKRWVWAEEDTLHPLANRPPNTHTHRRRADRAEVTARAEWGEGQGQARGAGRKPPRKQVNLLLWVREGGPEHPWGNQDPWAGVGVGAQPGPGHQPSNPLQYSCLGNAMDGGAW